MALLGDSPETAQQIRLAATLAAVPVEASRPGTARGLRAAFEGLALAYAEFCESEGEAWIGAEPGGLLEVGARHLLPLAEVILAGEADGPEPWDAALSAWTLMDGALRAAWTREGKGSCLAKAHVAARSLEYMLGGLVAEQPLDLP